MSNFIAGDWGTSRLRLALCDQTGEVLETKEGPGVAVLDRRLAPQFRALVADWTSNGEPTPAVLCGMAGSTLGWREVPYLPCPIHPEKLSSGVLRFEDDGRHIAIAPGLSCRNRLNAPDVMRGEETQILGALRILPELARGTHLLCMPGTHTKWVILRDGVIEEFLTGVSGELFEALRNHSVLVGKADAPIPVSRTAFDRALAQIEDRPDADLIHLLFATRSRQLSGEIKPGDAPSYLSGLVIGRDVTGAMRLFARELEKTGSIAIVGARDLAALYAAAFETHGISAKRIDGGAASLAGLVAFRETLSRTDWAHAS